MKSWSLKKVDGGLRWVGVLALLAWASAPLAASSPGIRDLEGRRQRWESLTPAEKERILRNYRRWKELPEDKKQLIQERLQVFHSLPAEKQKALHEEVARGGFQGSPRGLAKAAPESPPRRDSKRISPRSEVRAQKGERRERPGPPGSLERAPSARAERPEKIERAQRPERAVRVERVERPERPLRVEGAQRLERLERPAQNERPPLPRTP